MKYRLGYNGCYYLEKKITWWKFSWWIIIDSGSLDSMEEAIMKLQ